MVKFSNETLMSGPLFFRWFLSTNSISLIVIRILKLSISYWMSCGGLCFSRNWCISLKLASFCIELFTVFCHYPSDLCSTYRNSSCFSPDATDLCLLFFSFPVFLEVCQLYCCFYCIFSLTIYLPSTFHSHNDHTVVPVSYTHLTLPTIQRSCRSRWSPYH